MSTFKLSEQVAVSARSKWEISGKGFTAQTTGCPHRGSQISGTDTSCRSTPFPSLESSAILTISHLNILCSLDANVFTNIDSVCSEISRSTSLSRFVTYEHWLPLSRMILTWADKPELWGLLALILAVCRRRGIVVDTCIECTEVCGDRTAAGVVGAWCVLVDCAGLTWGVPTGLDAVQILLWCLALQWVHLLDDRQSLPRCPF